MSHDGEKQRCPWFREPALAFLNYARLDSQKHLVLWTCVYAKVKRYACICSQMRLYTSKTTPQEIEHATVSVQTACSTTWLLLIVRPMYLYIYACISVLSQPYKTSMAEWPIMSIRTLKGFSRCFASNSLTRVACFLIALNKKIEPLISVS